MEPNLAPHLDIGTPPRFMLGPLTTPWIQKHHQEEVKTLARTPPYPAKDRDKLEESLRVQRSEGSTSFNIQAKVFVQGSLGAYIIPPKYKISATNSN